MEYLRRIQKFQLQILNKQRSKICSTVAENVERKGIIFSNPADESFSDSLRKSRRKRKRSIS